MLRQLGPWSRFRYPDPEGIVAFSKWLWLLVGKPLDGICDRRTILQPRVRRGIGNGWGFLGE
jgi:hypothetical protein